MKYKHLILLPEFMNNITWPQERYEISLRALKNIPVNYFSTREKKVHISISFPVVKPRADATLLAVTCCVRLYTLLDVVACCWSCRAKFETGQTFQPRTPNVS